MAVVLRPGRPEDKAAIVPFTIDTFEWGDYIDRVYEDWLADDRGRTVVAEVDGSVVGMARGAFLSPTEAWAQGLRVNPNFRRRKVGTALLEDVSAWAADRGARVIRLASDDANSKAHAMIPTVGFRRAGHWVIAEKETRPGRPRAHGNGGKRAALADRLRPAPAVEADVAMISWSGGELEAAAHGLFPTHWTWRRLTLADLAEAGRRGALWQGRPGWVLGQQEEGTLVMQWLSTYPEDARALVAGLSDLAAASGADGLHVTFPDVEWLRAAFEQAGFESHTLTVFTRGL